MTFRFTTPLWAWQGDAPWFFVTVPREESDDIRDRPRMPRGFGSVKVRVTVGDSSWETSVFPDSTVGQYILPVKKAVRMAEGISEGDEVDVQLELIEL
ncbi:DUF1905 domain-containing protein [Mycetocola manganoxydans]|uniref:DUF1905 domain-containing protein n=1 Tax=Mycetocola manganoxydans TaxID=699879 RepID=A0A3L6ZMS8_9MICO|nr:DUF1905 domain-containing protein [Mycetocola manganoxydans]RLP68312.1 DUF1905 domain-containing protein [Mycetocola manganoxydans]GHD43660.1 hypothetical protein GCM10008097_10640 [Mycetocola manganoxydans]